MIKSCKSTQIKGNQIIIGPEQSFDLKQALQLHNGLLTMDLKCRAVTD